MSFGLAQAVSGSPGPQGAATEFWQRGIPAKLNNSSPSAVLD
jgi:hypothetical protein